MEEELIRMGDSDDRSRSPSSSSSSKRPRSADDYELRDDEGQDDQGDNSTDDTEQQPFKKRRTERRVPIRKAALKELNDRRAAKSTRVATAVAQKIKRPKRPKRPKKDKKEKKEKSAKQRHRLPDHGELVTGPERFDDSDLEPTVGKWPSISCPIAC